MPRVYTKKATRGAKHVRNCDKCREALQPGQTFYTWEFRYGGKHYQHTSCGHPRPSQLTQSKLSGVYEARESAEDTLSSTEWDEAQEPSTYVDDISSLLSDVASTVRETAEEYREASVNPNTGAVFNTQAEEWADELDSYADELEGWQASDEEPSHYPAEERNEDTTGSTCSCGKAWPCEEDDGGDWLDNLKQEAQEALDNLQL